VSDRTTAAIKAYADKEIGEEELLVVLAKPRPPRGRHTAVDSDHVTLRAEAAARPLERLLGEQGHGLCTINP
jgi:hypothetical protein